MDTPFLFRWDRIGGIGGVKEKMDGAEGTKEGKRKERKKGTREEGQERREGERERRDSQGTGVVVKRERVESACCSGRPPSAVVVRADRIKKRAAKGNSKGTRNKQASRAISQRSLPKWSGGGKTC